MKPAANIWLTSEDEDDEKAPAREPARVPPPTPPGLSRDERAEAVSAHLRRLGDGLRELLRYEWIASDASVKRILDGMTRSDMEGVVAGVAELRLRVIELMAARGVAPVSGRAEIGRFETAPGAQPRGRMNLKL